MTTRRQILNQLMLISAALLSAGLALNSPLRAQGEPQAPGKKVAFLVGVDRYLKPGFPPLDCCERDVQEVEQALKSLGFEKVEVLLGSASGAGQATKANIERSLLALVESLG